MQIERPLKITVWMLCVLLVPQLSPGEPALSNAQKKELVYKMYADYRKDFPGVTDISYREAFELLKKDDVVFVDTRKPDEMEISMLPHAVTQKEFMNHPKQYSDKTVIVYCTISYRSGIFAREMAKKGIIVYNLTGGMLAWTLEGGKIYDANGETKRIHVFGTKWNYAPAGFAVVMFGPFGKLF